MCSMCNFNKEQYDVLIKSTLSIADSQNLYNFQNGGKIYFIKHNIMSINAYNTTIILLQTKIVFYSLGIVII